MQVHVLLHFRVRQLIGLNARNHDTPSRPYSMNKHHLGFRWPPLTAERWSLRWRVQGDMPLVCPSWQFLLRCFYSLSQHSNATNPPICSCAGACLASKNKSNNKYPTVLRCAVLLWFALNARFLSSSQNVRFPYK